MMNGVKGGSRGVPSTVLCDCAAIKWCAKTVVCSKHQCHS